MKKYIIVCFITLIICKSYSQRVDTLKYYTPYYPDSTNTVAFVAACYDSGWCEPIGVWFTPDSTLSDSSYDYYSIKNIRFCFGWDYKDIAFSIHVGDEYPDESNRIYRQEISIYLADINPNFLDDGIYLFKEFDISHIQALKNLEINQSFWVVLEAKVFTTYNTTNSQILLNGSNNSFINGLPVNQWEKAYCNWIIETKIQYHKNIVESIEEPNKENMPNEHLLLENYPNPFNSNSQIVFSVNQTQTITVKIYNVLGKEVKTFD